MGNEELGFLASFLNEGIVIDDYLHQAKYPEDTPAVSKAEESEEVFVSDILFKGNNSSKVAVCVLYENEEWITVRDKLFLEKILTAVGLSMETIALVNLKNSNYKSIIQIGERLKGNKIITLGIPSALVKDFPLNEISQKNGQDYLCINWNLTDIAMSKDKKNVLWKKLKSLFEL